MKKKKMSQATESSYNWGTAYVKIPRSVVEMLYSPRVLENKKGKFLLHLFFQAYFKDGYVQTRTKSFICKRGCSLLNIKKLSFFAAVSKFAGYRCLRTIERAGCITLERIAESMIVKINGFDKFMGDAPDPMIQPLEMSKPLLKPVNPADISAALLDEMPEQQPPKKPRNDYWGASTGE